MRLPRSDLALKCETGSGLGSVIHGTCKKVKNILIYDTLPESRMMSRLESMIFRCNLMGRSNRFTVDFRAEAEIYIGILSRALVTCIIQISHNQVLKLG